jgi:Tfp pilus assembly protein PilX
MLFEDNTMTLSLKQQTAHLQQGAALIAVLVILVVITLLGVTAMRMGVTSLALATNSQVVQVLFQSADLGTNQLVNTVNQTGTAALNTTGVLAGSKGALCVTPVTTATFTNLTSGACDADSATSYLNKSKVVFTQVNYEKQLLTGWESNASQSDISNSGQSDSPLGQTQKLLVSSTAVVPSFGSAGIDSINTCLGKDIDDSNDVTIETITDCLTNAGAVFTTHESEYKINNKY